LDRKPLFRLCPRGGKNTRPTMPCASIETAASFVQNTLGRWSALILGVESGFSAMGVVFSTHATAAAPPQLRFRSPEKRALRPLKAAAHDPSVLFDVVRATVLDFFRPNETGVPQAKRSRRGRVGAPERGAGDLPEAAVVQG